MIAPPTRIEVLIFEGCPHAQPAVELAERVALNMDPLHITVETMSVDTPQKAAATGFLGSPSLRVDGVDIELGHSEEGALCCRTYEGGSGLPPRWLLEAAVLRARPPKGILFLCVANSARSQIAEGLGRALATEGMTILSAGSEPTQVRPEASAVLEEIGIPTGDHRSKNVTEIPVHKVDTVITLCAEEECPVFLGQATRLHWGLTDPAAVGGDQHMRLDAFRQTRDELSRRLKRALGH